MARQYKCIFCGEVITEAENKIPVKNRYAHERCFNLSLKITDKKQKELKQKKLTERKTNPTSKSNSKPQAELKEGLSEKEYQEKKSLFDKIRAIQSTDKLTAKTYKLIEDYVKKYNFTYVGMQQALEYFYEIENNAKTDDCVGIIPYVYDKAQQRLKDIAQASEQNNKAKIQQTTRIVKITPHRNKGELIDINKIGQ